MLTILPLNFSGIRNLPVYKKQPIFKGSSDSFEKVTPLSDFEKWVFEHDFDVKQISDIIKDGKNLLGKGNNHSVYSIPNCEEYVLRIVTSDKDALEKIGFSEVEIVNTEDKELKANIGQEVAKIRIKNNRQLPISIEILKKQKGEPIGVKTAETFYVKGTSQLREGEVEYEHPLHKERYIKSIEQLSDLSVESFIKLIRDYKNVIELGYVFDFLNSNNLLIDPDNGEINMIDMDKNQDASQEKLDGLLYALINAEYYPTFMNNATSIESQEITIKLADIIRKFIQAMQVENSQFNEDDLQIEFRNYVLNSTPCMLAYRAFDEYTLLERFRSLGVI